MTPPPSAKKTTTNASAAATPPGADETLDDVVKEATDFVASAIKDVADTCTSSLKQIQAGNYKVENAWSDAIKMWSTSVTNMTKALDLGTRAAKASAKNPPETGSTPTGYET